MSCSHNQVKRIEDSYMPDYSIPQSSADCARLVNVPQWECIKCGTKLGYLSYYQEVVKVVKTQEQYDRECIL